MTAQMLLRLALVPTAVWIASLAARRWGHRVSGYLGGMPMIGGPITLFLAIDLGPEFAARSALFTLAAIAGQAAHLLTFAWVGRRARWPLALASGWSAFAATSFAVSRVPLDPLVALATRRGGSPPRGAGCRARRAARWRQPSRRWSCGCVSWLPWRLRA